MSRDIHHSWNDVPHVFIFFLLSFWPPQAARSGVFGVSFVYSACHLFKWFNSSKKNVCFELNTLLCVCFFAFLINSLWIFLLWISNSLFLPIRALWEKCWEHVLCRVIDFSCKFQLQFSWVQECFGEEKLGGYM